MRDEVNKSPNCTSYLNKLDKHKRPACYKYTEIHRVWQSLLAVSCSHIEGLTAYENMLPTFSSPW